MRESPPFPLLGPREVGAAPRPLLRVPGSCCWDLALVSWNPPGPPIPPASPRRGAEEGSGED